MLHFSITLHSPTELSFAQLLAAARFQYVANINIVVTGKNV